MGPEIEGVFLDGRGPEVEVLELGEGEERGCYEDVYSQHVQPRMVEEEGVLEGELA